MAEIESPIDSPPPDPRPRKPRMDVPPLACDCHAHVYMPPARHPYAPNLPYLPPDVGLEEYRHMLKMLGLSRAVIIQPTIYRDNGPTAEALREAGGKWRGIAVFNAGVPFSELKSMDETGFRGVRMHPSRMTNLEQIRLVASSISDLGWHIQVHIEGDRLAEFLPRISGLPTDIAIDHFGRISVENGINHQNFQALLRFMDSDKAWVKLSAANRFVDPEPPYPSLAPFARKLIEAFPDRILWGSDWPHAGFHGVMPNDADLLDLVSEWTSSKEVQRQILVDNPQRLYGFAAG